MTRPTAIILLALAASLSAQEPPSRVVSLAPSITEAVNHLGATDRLVAVTPFCQAPPQIDRLPGGIQPEAEAVLGLDPDLVLATSMTPATTRDLLGNLGLRVEVIDAGSLEAIRAAQEKLAALLEVAATASPMPVRPAPGGSAVLLFGADTGYSAGRGTHAHEILEEAGLRNIAADAGGPWPQLGEEVLLAADPDVIIVADYGGADRGSVLRALRAHGVRKHWKSVRAGRVVVFPAAAFSVPGPGALEAPAKLRAEVDKL